MPARDVAAARRRRSPPPSAAPAPRGEGESEGVSGAGSESERDEGSESFEEESEEEDGDSEEEDQMAADDDLDDGLDSGLDEEGGDGYESESDGGSDSDSDGEDAEGKGAAAAGEVGMAAAFHAIMGRAAEKRQRDGAASAAAPAQIKGPRRLQQLEAEERQDSARRAEGRAARKKRRALGHVPLESCTGPQEKVLVRVATKGVVRLFNAVAKAQELREAAEARGEKRRDVAKLSRSSFLSELKKVSSASDAKTADGSAGLPAAADEPASTGWRVLDDDALDARSMKLKDWDKEQEVELDMEVDTGIDHGSSDDDEE